MDEETSRMFDPQPVVLEGKYVRVEPLAREHAADLIEAGSDEEIWRYMPRGPLMNSDDANQWIAEAQAPENEIAFAIVQKNPLRAVGSTRFLDIRRLHRGFEIGWTWIGKPWHRGVVNTECKLLLLTHAFDDLKALRVQLKTDHRNVQSQRAIEALGATLEGVLRQHMRVWDGSIRDTVMYSIVAEEWPDVRARLGERLRVRIERQEAAGGEGGA